MLIYLSTCSYAPGGLNFGQKRKYFISRGKLSWEVVVAAPKLVINKNEKQSGSKVKEIPRYKQTDIQALLYKNK